MSPRYTGPPTRSSNSAIGGISEQGLQPMTLAANPFTSDFLHGGADELRRPQGRLSYVSGLTDDPLKFITIPQLLDRACARYGAAEAAVFVEQKLSMSWYYLRKRADD